MADSDDEYDRKRRDKFRGERAEATYRGAERVQRPREEWPEREAWSRPRQREYRAGGIRDRGYSPGLEPAAKRMRHDYYGESYYNHYAPYHQAAHRANFFREPAAPAAIEGQPPPMMSFKAFLATQDDNISDSEAIEKYNDYKLEFQRQQLNEFFVAHKDDEWFRVKYHPEDSIKRKEEQAASMKKRLEVFMDLLNSGSIEKVTIDCPKTTELLKLLDTVVIKLEGGTDEDLALLEKEYTEMEEKYKEQKAKEESDKEKAEKQAALKKEEDEKKEEKTSEEQGKTNGEDSSKHDEEDDGEIDKSTDKVEGEENEEEKEEEKKEVEASEEKEKEDEEKMEVEKEKEENGEKDKEEEAVDKDEEKVENKSSDKEEEVEEEEEEEKKKEDKEEEGEDKEKSEKKKKEKVKRKRSYSGSSSSSSSSSSSDEEGEKKDEDEEKKESKEDEGEKGAEDEKKSEKQEDKEEEKIETIEDDKPEKPKSLHKTTSIFLRNLSPTITKQEVEAMCARYEGFLRVALADPQPDRRWLRRGWVTFKREANIKEICWNLNNIRLRECELGAIVNRDLSRRIRPVNGISAHKNVVRSDIRISAKVTLHLDNKNGLWLEEDKKEKQQPTFGLVSNNPVLHNITDYLIEEASAEEEELLGIEPSSENLDSTSTVERDESLIAVLDKILLYLRIVHSVDYYNHCEYPNEDEMPNRCGILHARGPPPASKTDVTQFTGAAVESKMAAFLPEKAASAESTSNEAKLVALSLKDVDAEVDKFVQANTRELAKDKWLCPLSGKKFKGPDFVRKHIFNKHGEKIEEVKKEVEFFNSYLKDPKRPMLVEAPAPKREEPPAYSHPNYGGGGSYGGGGYGRPPPYYNQGFAQRSRGYPQRTRGNPGDFRPIIHYRDLDAPREPEEFI
ncbi:unnamed protein product [Brassicogethes aeneus]|uniref:Serrate RNA effector molecule homolog n=1 Tax=Brassicogethes aeneus TaxID=1431903 RepID=A0A9P0FAR7_BRAAE|nr:unnamed protein product [Brassicogethes aeneus]